MKFLFCLIIGVPLLLALGCQKKAYDSAVNIVGGVENDEIHPEVISVIAKFADRTSKCTGTVMRDDLVMTAAHCVSDNPQWIIAAPSLSHGPEKLHREVRLATGYLVYPEYTGDTFDNDLAFVIFPKGTYRSYPKGKLATKSPEVGEFVQMVGYGRTDNSDPTSNPESKRHTGTSNKVIYLPDISDAIYIVTTEVGSTTSGIAVGDSGGALFNRHGEIVGITAAGTPKLANEAISEENLYISIFTNVNSLKIAAFIWEVMSTPDPKGKTLE